VLAEYVMLKVATKGTVYACSKLALIFSTGTPPMYVTGY
jgi:hypothetical protein